MSPKPCTACGAGGTQRCESNGTDLGTCQPATPWDFESCGNSCDENADGVEGEGCAGPKTYDYCERDSAGALVRWTCGCGLTAKVGYCLGSTDSQTSCASPEGCLKAPNFGATGAAQAGGDYACCVSSLPCASEGYIRAAMHCEQTDSLRFECAPGDSCDDSNACGNTCKGLAPTINPTTGAQSRGGAYCSAGPVCSAAQGGFGPPQEGNVSASIYRVECGWASSADMGSSYTCHVVSRPGLTLTVPPPEHSDGPRDPRGDRDEIGGSTSGGKDDETGASPTPDTANACLAKASQVTASAIGATSSPTVSLSDFTTRYSASDLGIRLPGSGFNFVRKYVSTDNFWSYQSMLGNADEPFVAKPFGSSPTRKSSLRWWHGLYSMVQPQGWVGGVSTWAVRDPEGSVLEFVACTPGTISTTPCFASPRKTTRWSNASLLWTGSHFVLIKPGDGRYVYQSPWTHEESWYVRTKYFFLTRVEDEASASPPRVRLELTYAVPSVWDENDEPVACPGQSSLGNGVPYLRDITTETGARVRLRYRLVRASVQPTTECVIDSLSLARNPNAIDPLLRQQEDVVARYEYYTHPSLPSVQRAGLLAQVEYPETGDVVTYGDTTTSDAGSTQWGVAANSQVLATHAYQAGKVQAVGAGGTTTMAFSTGSGNCGGPSPMGLDAGTPCVPPSVEGMTASSGDSSGTTVQFTRGFSTRVSPYSPHPLLETQSDTCLSGDCRGFASGYLAYEYAEPEDGNLYLRRTRNKAQSYVRRDRVFAEEGVASVPGVVSPVIQVTENFGETYQGDGGVAGATTNFIYSNSPLPADQAWQPVTESVSVAASTFKPGEQVITRTRHDASTGFLKSVIRSGYTHQLDMATGTWSPPVLQHIGVFYFNHHRCLGATDSGTARLAEIHGPCLISSPEATDCSGTDFPITQHHHYGPPSAEPSNQAGKLKKVSQFIRHGGPLACAGHPTLETRYDEYDGRGNPVQVRSPQGEVTRIAYIGGRISRSTSGGLLTTYQYDGARQLAVHHPSGAYTVSCYRKNTPAGQGCAQGELTSVLQWEAVASDAAGVDWSEMRVLEYWPHGALKTETLRSRGQGTEETRRTVSHHPDPHLRPTFTRWGTGPGSFSATSAFDVRNNLVATGDAFNTPPDFCKDGNAVSPACTALAYDNLSRLTRVSELPTPGVEQHSTYDYDVHGNVSSVRMGCSSTDPTSCGGSSTYQFDDFGRLVSVLLPNARGPVHHAHDARGNVVARQTEAMRGAGAFIRYEHDLLSRPLTASSVHWSDDYRSFHYRLGYDDDEAPPAGCATQLNSLGKLRFRQDSFGRTWFQYDAAGRVVREMRVRATATGCAQGLEANPDTFYEYDAVGRLSRLTYPHGRTVTYVYGTGANAERVAAVDVSTYDGATWQTRRIVSTVAWEPFGGLRGYQMHHAGSGTSSSVEYMLGDDSSSPPTSSADACTRPAPSASASDLTGRWRALRVSSGAFSPGSGSGDIYNRTFTWTANQLSRMDTCVLDSAEAQTELYSYDRTLRLTGATRPPGNALATGGAYTSRTYGYDRRSNRTASTDDGVANSFVFWAMPTDGPDAVGVHYSDPGQLAQEWYFYDGDGRFNRKSTARDGPTGMYLHMYPQYYTGLGFLEGTFQAVYLSSGAYYNYFYDAHGRRRLKVHPTGAREEYFHDLGNQLLSDSAPNDLVTSATHYVEDDYVWLGGRPVAVLRGKFSTTWARQADDSADCTRAGEPAACGLYFLVTERSGMPVVMLDDSRRVTGVGEYDPFGHVNRVKQVAGSTNPYADSLNVELKRFEQPTRSSQLRLQQRVLFNLVETEPTQDFVRLEDSVTHAALSGAISGKKPGKFWSDWVEPSSGSLSIQFVSNATCDSATCGGDAGAGLGCTCPSEPSRGVVLKGTEYRRFQQGATPFWVPLRFRGQYHDIETDFFANGHRYYEPELGRYMDPEPLLGAAPIAFPAYAYALNNPVMLDDPTGLVPGEIFRGGTMQELRDRAAIDALEFIHPSAELYQMEYGGMLCLREDGGVFATDPVCSTNPDDLKTVYPQDAPCPEGTKSIGGYHTHPGNSQDMDNKTAPPFSYHDVKWSNSFGTFYLSRANGAEIWRWYPHPVAIRTRIRP
ncbi:RHS repeat-associated core domain-containing protein [Myxococcus llanfairpwllgwyngyllgogerychwyrndrobwllllantysiliogogogochensis]|nr:RHS repeat-associated core domain-containing protein [Myxococcus llanfairpwllgwyngyllgogerychwyrndrobwllllantysiliogogogochensis]